MYVFSNWHFLMPPCIEIVKVFVFTNTVTFLLPHTWVGGVYVCIVVTLISFLLEDKTKYDQRILSIRILGTPRLAQMVVSLVISAWQGIGHEFNTQRHWSLWSHPHISYHGITWCSCLHGFLGIVCTRWFITLRLVAAGSIVVEKFKDLHNMVGFKWIILTHQIDRLRKRVQNDSLLGKKGNKRGENGGEERGQGSLVTWELSWFWI